MAVTAGLGKTDRERLSRVLRGTRGTITVGEATALLAMSRTDTAKLLSRWAARGWLCRVQRGLYVPVALESRSGDIPLEDAWQVAAQLFAPCYIGGWTAAGYWNLTEQLFRTVVAMTNRRPRQRRQTLQGTEFWLRSVPERNMFGLKQVWRGQVKVAVSDPTRTLLDLLDDPQLGGGLRSTVDMFRNYLASEEKNLPLLLDYANQLGNGAVYKRLGFLLERFAPNETDAIMCCRKNLTAGYAQLDAAQKKGKLLSRWHLWVPASFISADEKAGE